MEFVSAVDTEYSVVSAQWLHDKLVDFAAQYGHVRIGDRRSNATAGYNDLAPLCIDVNCTLMNPPPKNRYWFRVAPDGGWGWESRSFSTWKSKEPHAVEESGDCHTEVEVLAQFETFLSWRLLPRDRPEVPGSAFDLGHNLRLADELMKNLGVPRIQSAAADRPRRPSAQSAISQPTRAGSDLRTLIGQATATPAGMSGAHEYHRGIAVVLGQLFDPYLADLTVEQEIDRGTKRVDIVAENVAKGGFFAWVQQNFPPVPYVLIECKNGTVDPANPELDQLLGRFSQHRGHFGLLMCRAVLDLDRLLTRCREAFKNGRGAVIPITDSDLLELLEQKGTHGDFPLLRHRFRYLAM